jgi:hypothetical protein
MEPQTKVYHKKGRARNKRYPEGLLRHHRAEEQMAWSKEFLERPRLQSSFAFRLLLDDAGSVLP